jgi:hypothetical protein
VDTPRPTTNITPLAVLNTKSSNGSGSSSNMSSTVLKQSKSSELRKSKESVSDIKRPPVQKKASFSASPRRKSSKQSSQEIQFQSVSEQTSDHHHYNEKRGPIDHEKKPHLPKRPGTTTESSIQASDSQPIQERRNWASSKPDIPQPTRHQDINESRSFSGQRHSEEVLKIQTRQGQGFVEHQRSLSEA